MKKLFTRIATISVAAMMMSPAFANVAFAEEESVVEVIATEEIAVSEADNESEVVEDVAEESTVSADTDTEEITEDEEVVTVEADIRQVVLLLKER